MKITTTLLSVLVNLYCFGTDYYVNDASTTNDLYCTAVGSAANDGLTPATPLNSLTQVLSTYSGSLTSGDRIFIDAGVYSDANVTLNIDGISIIGAGALITQFDNDYASADANILFDITGDDITLEYFLVAGYNNASDAFAIYIDGAQNLTINYVLVDENLPGGGSSAIIITGGADVTFNGGGSNCNSPLPSVAGGGINVEGNGNTVVINDYTLANNSKSHEGGSGLYVKGTDGTTVVTVNNSIFSDNWNGSNAGGAAIALVGATLNINGTCFTNNECYYTGGPIYGGAITIARGATLTIDNCSFSGNSITSGSGRGGAIGLYTRSALGSTGASTVTITNSSFDGNSVTDDGNHIYNRVSTYGATINIDNCSFSSTGDDIYNYSGTINQQNSGNPSTTGTINKINLTNPSGTPVTSCPVLQGTCYGIILASELIDFNAICKTENQYEIEFTVSSEMNNKEYVLEYATSDYIYSELIAIESIGNHSDEHTYSETIRVPSNAKYLRLKELDNDGETNTLKVTPLFNCNEEPVASISDNTLWINGDNLDGSFKCQIIDLSGRIVYLHSSDNTTKKQIKMENVNVPSKGIYIVHFLNEKQEFTQRIVSF